MATPSAGIARATARPETRAPTEVGGEAVKLWRARAVPGRGSVEPGTIVSVDEHGVGVACGDGGRLELTELQRAGGKRLVSADFLRGFPLQPGQRFDT